MPVPGPKPEPSGRSSRRAEARALRPVVPPALAGTARARGGPPEQELALARVARDRRRALELRARLLVPAEPREQVAADARQQVVALERSLGDELVDELE